MPHPKSLDNSVTGVYRCSSEFFQSFQHKNKQTNKQTPTKLLVLQQQRQDVRRRGRSSVCSWTGGVSWLEMRWDESCLLFKSISSGCTLWFLTALHKMNLPPVQVANFSKINLYLSEKQSPWPCLNRCIMVFPTTSQFLKRCSWTRAVKCPYRLVESSWLCPGFS